MVPKIRCVGLRVSNVMTNSTGSCSRSPVAAVAYHSRDKFHDLDGRVFDYRDRNDELVKSTFVLPSKAFGKDVPSWVCDPEEFAQALEYQSSIRKSDTKIMGELELTIPHELPPDVAEALVRKLVQSVCDEEATVAHVFFHDNEHGSSKNFHAHVDYIPASIDMNRWADPSDPKLFKNKKTSAYVLQNVVTGEQVRVAGADAAKRLERDGFEKLYNFRLADGTTAYLTLTDAEAHGLGKADRTSRTPLKKTEYTNDFNKSSFVSDLRSRWCDLVNSELEDEGSDVRYDPRSYDDQSFRAGDFGMTEVEANELTELQQSKVASAKLGVALAAKKRRGEPVNADIENEERLEWNRKQDELFGLIRSVREDLTDERKEIVDEIREIVGSGEIGELGLAGVDIEEPARLAATAEVVDFEAARIGVEVERAIERLAERDGRDRDAAREVEELRGRIAELEKARDLAAGRVEIRDRYVDVVRRAAASRDRLGERLARAVAAFKDCIRERAGALLAGIRLLTEGVDAAKASYRADHARWEAERSEAERELSEGEYSLADMLGGYREMRPIRPEPQPTAVAAAERDLAEGLARAREELVSASRVEFDGRSLGEDDLGEVESMAMKVERTEEYADYRKLIVGLEKEYRAKCREAEEEWKAAGGDKAKEFRFSAPPKPKEFSCTFLGREAALEAGKSRDRARAAWRLAHGLKGGGMPRGMRGGSTTSSGRPRPSVDSGSRQMPQPSMSPQRNRGRTR